MAFYGYPEYVPVAEKKRRAQQAVGKLRKKDPAITPVIITGRKLAVTWWGEAWNDNLESYSDYENRIGRGRSYLRNGAVLDLKLERGTIKALVQGSASIPYQVEIAIRPLTESVWAKLKKTCEGKIESLPELIDGKFPKELGELFTAKGSGLFPAPREITLSCSCPDWAIMCKHVAAVLYGVGARLDEDPSLFFTLRGVKIEELISEAIRGKAQSMLGHSGVKSRRILEDVDVTAMFGVEVAAAEMVPELKAKAKKKEPKSGNRRKKSK
ncbi:MAG TPA: hypothetical protein DDW65_09275 [Firmicutes bacterium]|jgi:uncharacterized Zn finger protein|nr:hypothetical protein [Bacillota bacterium]